MFARTVLVLAVAALHFGGELLLLELCERLLQLLLALARQRHVEPQAGKVARRRSGWMRQSHSRDLEDAALPGMLADPVL